MKFYWRKIKDFCMSTKYPVPILSLESTDLTWLMAKRRLQGIMVVFSQFCFAVAERVLPQFWILFYTLDSLWQFPRTLACVPQAPLLLKVLDTFPSFLFPFLRFRVPHSSSSFSSRIVTTRKFANINWRNMNGFQKL